jgi:hypothetical protein
MELPLFRCSAIFCLFKKIFWTSALVKIADKRKRTTKGSFCYSAVLHFFADFLKYFKENKLSNNGVDTDTDIDTAE